MTGKETLNKSLQGKKVLVTGATSGIGEVTARVLAAMGAQLAIVGRNRSKTERTVERIGRQTGAETEPFICDFGSPKQIQSLAQQLEQRFDCLDVLVNNAGSVFLNYGETAEGIERTFAVNHLGYFRLTNLLLDLLDAAPAARVVNVASAAHKGSRIHLENLNLKGEYRAMKAYGQSKLANIMFTYELARRLEDSTVTVNALHPGFIATNIGANNLPLIGGLVKRIVNLRAEDVETGAQTSVYLASSPEVEGVSGRYFVRRKPRASSPESYDEAVQGKLWSASEALSAPFFG